ncbi:hypothetical protein RHEC894_PE00333 (plasmid) [Rhizobium sp. CIAT894]|uniref:hypothetical protein n=1 Tax=Rhizobium sp. CIAT894 TaxID=2020312 RepID=UPI000A1DCD36|nr:hypothetical protein [Rhizobium sp. CIAT894]ARM92356.1 hypothetical protein RHEC894_PE00333 [Rhizobium sp. CIAT894]
MTFPPPKTEAPVPRFEEATIAARDALERLIAAANEAGWATGEITAAILKAAQFLSDANKKDPDPAEDPVSSDTARQEQIGHGELYD